MTTVTVVQTLQHLLQ